MKKIFNNLNLFKLSHLGLIVGLLLVSSCTDLDVEKEDSILQADFAGVDPTSSLEGLYNNLKGYIGSQSNLFALSEVSTDSQLIPTRGGDWGDNGLWRQIHQHSWAPDHQFFTDTWNQWNSLQLGASQVLSPLSGASANDSGQASFLRALGMYIILDNFGQVPFRDLEADGNTDPEVLTGATAVDFIISDLNDAIANLNDIAPGNGTRRPGKAAARYLLAKVLLNRHVFTGSGSANAADMTQVVQLVDQIKAGGFDLDSNGYFDIFKEDDDNETIWFIEAGVGERIWNGLHYNQGAPGNEGGGWNGFSTLAEYYDLFEGDPNSNYVGDGQEERRGWVPDASNVSPANSAIGFGFLINLQYDDDGTPLTDRTGAPLIFKRDFTDGTGSPNLSENDETTGIRVIKYHPANGSFTEHQSFFRYADAHLMKAEAILRGGSSSETALGLVNELRAARNANGNTAPMASLTEQDLLDERGRELYIEFWRRNDLIRFGQYNRDWTFKDPAAINNTNRNLFPIPDSQVNLNPNLIQNPGY